MSLLPYNSSQVLVDLIDESLTNIQGTVRAFIVVISNHHEASEEVLCTFDQCPGSDHTVSPGPRPCSAAATSTTIYSAAIKWCP